jgi:hypothetical protein
VEPLSEDVIRKSFVNCSKGDARRLTLPGRLADVDWPDLDFLGWRDPKAPNNGYVVFRRAGDVLGLALLAAPRPKGHFRQSMCALCNTVQGAADVALFSARRVGAAGKLGNTVGTYICADLACCLYVRGRRKPSVQSPRQTATVEERLERTLANLNRFADDVLTDNS